MTAVRFNFLGRDARDVGRTGETTTTDLAAWIEQRYDAGWKALTVQHVPTKRIDDGRVVAVRGAPWPVVGGIGPGPDGDRIWWAEAVEP